MYICYPLFLQTKAYAAADEVVSKVYKEHHALSVAAVNSLNTIMATASVFPQTSEKIVEAIAWLSNVDSEV